MFTVIGVFNLFFEIATAAAAQAPDPQAIVKPLPLSKTLSCIEFLSIMDIKPTLIPSSQVPWISRATS